MHHPDDILPLASACPDCWAAAARGRLQGRPRPSRPGRAARLARRVAASMAIGALATGGWASPAPAAPAGADRPAAEAAGERSGGPPGQPGRSAPDAADDSRGGKGRRTRPAPDRPSGEQAGRGRAGADSQVTRGSGRQGRAAHTVARERARQRVGAKASPRAAASANRPRPRGVGYQLVTARGDVVPFGTASFEGSAAGLGARISGVARTATGRGYWQASRDGGVFTYGDARFYGSMGGHHLNAPIIDIVSTPSGNGYWLVSADGGIFTYGDARYYGSVSSLPLRAPIVGLAPTRGGKGYWLASADGGVFAFGTARYQGGATAAPLNGRITDIATASSGVGYWLLGSDGGVFAFGSASYRGAAGDYGLQGGAVELVPSDSGRGYWIASSDGGVFSFGDAPFLGSTAGLGWSGPVVGMVAGEAEARPGRAPGRLTSRLGHDISWPQCDGAYPDPGYGYGIVGVTGGRPFTQNRCLRSQAAWARSTGSGLGLYVNVASARTPDERSMSGPAGACTADDVLCQAYNHSARNMLEAIGYARSQGADAPMWWLDVETMNYWSPVPDINRRTIEAAIDVLRQEGYAVGIYSTGYQFRKIAGDFQPRLPVWVAGAPTDDAMPGWCRPDRAFGGGEVWLIQSLPVRFDNNWACDPVVTDPGRVFTFG